MDINKQNIPISPQGSIKDFWFWKDSELIGFIVWILILLTLVQFCLHHMTAHHKCISYLYDSFFFFFFFITRPSVDEWRQSGFKILSSQVTSNRPLGCTLKHNVSKIAPNRRQQFWLKLFRWRTIHCQKEKKHLEDKRLWKVSTHNLSVSKYEEYEVSHFNGIYPLF